MRGAGRSALFEATRRPLLCFPRETERAHTTLRPRDALSSLGPRERPQIKRECPVPASPSESAFPLWPPPFWPSISFARALQSGRESSSPKVAIRAVGQTRTRAFLCAGRGGACSSKRHGTPHCDREALSSLGPRERPQIEGESCPRAPLREPSPFGPLLWPAISFARARQRDRESSSQSCNSLDNREPKGRTRETFN